MVMTTVAMMSVKNEIQISKRLVLVGGGHAHVQVIKALNKASRPKHLHVTLIDVQKAASYSGMVPGCISNLYSPKDTLLELEPLAKWASIEFVHKRVVDIDLENKFVHVVSVEAEEQQLPSTLSRTNNSNNSKTSTIPFDVISIDIGSTSRGLDNIKGAREYSIPTRPISELLTRLEEATAKLKQQQQKHGQLSPIHVAVIGAGAAGIELSMSIMGRWKPIVAATSTSDAQGNEQQHPAIRVTLLDSGTELLPGEPLTIQNAIRQLLIERGVEIRHGCSIQEIQKDSIIVRTARQMNSNNGTPLETVSQREQEEIIPFSHCIFATGAGAHSLAFRLGQKTKKHGLAITDRGWIRVNPFMQSISHPFVFAAGDCSSIEGPGISTAPPKAGVYAVRAGPILIQNLVSYLGESPSSNNNHQETIDPSLSNPRHNLIEYCPQDDFMKLMVCGDGTAFGSRFGVPMHGKWVMQLKDRIDTMFMNLFKVENLPDLVEGQPYDTSQYDATRTRPPPMNPKDAAIYLKRTDNDVDYNVAWNIIRDMAENKNNYRNLVLQHVPSNSENELYTIQSSLISRLT